MLTTEAKIKYLKAYLFGPEVTYADSYKTDVLFFFDELEGLSEKDGRLLFLKKLDSKTEIHDWVDHLLSQIVLKFKEEEEHLSDFIFYLLNN